MDPTATLNRLRELVTEINSVNENERRPDLVDEFSTLFEALDDWMCKGGFLPTQWWTPK